MNSDVQFILGVELILGVDLIYITWRVQGKTTRVKL